MTEIAATPYRPRAVSPPGDTLADILEERGLTQAELANRMGRPLKTVNEVIKGKAAITPETAIQLERALGTSAEFWLARESRYQEWKARQADAECLQAETAWLKELPLRDMIRFKWVIEAATKVEQVAECLRYFAVASVIAWRAQYVAPLAAFRASEKSGRKVGAVAAWLRQGEIQASRMICRPFDKTRFREALKHLRSLTLESDPAIFVPRLEQLCAECGVAVVFVPTPQGCPASGATRWWTPEKAILQLSLRYKTNDHLWFTIFHEAGHLLLHGKKLLFLEDTGLDGEQENEADRFAGDQLIPPIVARGLKGMRSKAEVVAFADQVGIAPGIVVGRLQKEGLLPWDHMNGLKVRYSWAHEEIDDPGSRVGGDA